MADKTKKFLITTQKCEVVAIHKNNSQLRQYCADCQQQVEMLTLDAVTFHTGKRTREIFRLIENESLHSVETQRGHLLVCRNSLEKLDAPKLIDK